MWWYSMIYIASETVNDFSCIGKGKMLSKINIQSTFL